MTEMDDIAGVVRDLLGQLAEASDIPADSAPRQIIASSLDQMRFLVGLEERLDIMLDVGDVLPLDLTSRAALVDSVRDLLMRWGVAP